jgi:hypothetical protein
MSSWVSQLGRMVRLQRQPTSFAWTERIGNYALWDSYYSNTVFNSLDDGGYRDEINRRLGGASAVDLDGLYNPVRSVVNLYQHVFAGAFGDEIMIEPQEQADQRLVTAVQSIWKTSNLTIQKTNLCRMAARLGCVGLRIVADEQRQRVYLKIEHPRIIRDVELDVRGNVQSIQLEYDVTTGLAEEAQTITIREELTREYFKAWRMSNGHAIAPFDTLNMIDSGPNSVMPNALGVVPYVLLFHDLDTDDKFGVNAFNHVLPALNRVNSLLSHIDIQVHRTVRAKWLVAASGPAPQEFDLGDMTIAYVDMRSGTTPPMMQAMIANLSLADAVTQTKLQLELLEDTLPELKATNGKYLSGQSGETIAQLRKPARDLLVLARTNYEDALIRAQQIAVSWGVLMGIWDVGTGTGADSAQRAYTDGYEAMRFNTRPIFDDEVPAPDPVADVPNMPTDMPGDIQP